MSIRPARLAPGLIVSGIGALLPSWAVACPACATRQGPGMSTFVLVGAMILVPYGVTAIALKVIRRIDQGKDPNV